MFTRQTQQDAKKGHFMKGGYHAETYFSMLGSRKLTGTRDPENKQNFDGWELK